MNTPYIIEETNLSEAWCKTLQHIVENKGREVSPLVISLHGFDETTATKMILDKSLIKNELNSIDTVSETIFPESLYNYFNKDRKILYSTYVKNLARIKKVDSRNRMGTYFERLIAFDETQKVNQLEIIINSLQEETKNKRRSKLQASTFNPLTDHTNRPYQGFPCLQHVTFYKSESGGLILNSFYAVQDLYRKAYGNWLGLVNLGKFIAHQSNLRFERFNCFIGVEQLGQKMTKTKAKELLNQINSEKEI